MKYLKRLEVYFYNKNIFSKSFHEHDFPILKIGFFGPQFVPFKVSQDDWNDAVRETKIEFPFHVKLYRTDVHFHYSMAFFFGFYINYQWTY